MTLAGSTPGRAGPDGGVEHHLRLSPPNTATESEVKTLRVSYLLNLRWAMGGAALGSKRTSEGASPSNDI